MEPLSERVIFGETSSTGAGLGPSLRSPHTPAGIYLDVAATLRLPTRSCWETVNVCAVT